MDTGNKIKIISKNDDRLLTDLADILVYVQQHLGQSVVGLAIVYLYSIVTLLLSLRCNSS